jgi:hypothetical protein
MKYLNIIAEGRTEENFVNKLIAPYFLQLNIFVSVRRIRTGWDSANNKPAKGGLREYGKFRNDVNNWIASDNNRQNVWYSSFIDLYAFPKHKSPYDENIQSISDPYQKIKALEEAIEKDIDHPRFIPYIQLHEFEAFLLIEPELLVIFYPNRTNEVDKLKIEITHKEPERINESPETSPSKRIIKHLPEYKGGKAEVGSSIAIDIGMTKLREKCPHFNEWIEKLEKIFC